MRMPILTLLLTLLVTIIHVAPSAEAFDLNCGRFRRADVNIDDHIDLSDAVGILGFLFQGNENITSCLHARDVNADFTVDISDAIFLLDYLFRGTEPPPPPFAEPNYAPYSLNVGNAESPVATYYDPAKDELTVAGIVFRVFPHNATFPFFLNQAGAAAPTVKVFPDPTEYISVIGMGNLPGSELFFSVSDAVNLAQQHIYDRFGNEIAANLSRSLPAEPFRRQISARALDDKDFVVVGSVDQSETQTRAFIVRYHLTDNGTLTATENLIPPFVGMPEASHIVPVGVGKSTTGILISGLMAAHGEDPRPFLAEVDAIALSPKWSQILPLEEDEKITNFEVPQWFLEDISVTQIPDAFIVVYQVSDSQDGGTKIVKFRQSGEILWSKKIHNRSVPIAGATTSYNQGFVKLHNDQLLFGGNIVHTNGFLPGIHRSVSYAVLASFDLNGNFHWAYQYAFPNYVFAGLGHLLLKPSGDMLVFGTAGRLNTFHSETWFFEIHADGQNEYALPLELESYLE